ncbi:MAG: hypothetical protein B7Y93_09735, partial [Micrococcales bacterium 32-70-13]
MQHAEPAGEGCGVRPVGRDVGDRRVEHPAPHRSREVADQAGADDGAVGFVEVLAERPGLDVVAVGRGAQLGGRVVTAQHEGRSADTGAGERPAPQHELDDIAVDRDPLRLEALGQQRPVHPRCELDARGSLVRDRERL